MFSTEKEFEEGVKSTIEVLKETYINNIMYIQERMKENAEEDELKRIEEIIMATERMIVYFMQSDDWVKELHNEARGEVDETSDGSGTGDSGDDEAESARIEAARNS